MAPQTIAVNLAYKSAVLLPQAQYAGKPPMSLRRPLTIIGSGQAAHIRLQSRTVSRVHAVVLNTDGQALLRGLSSDGPVCVNGAPVREAVLQDGDTVQVGRFTFRTSLPGEPATASSGDVPAAQLWCDDQPEPHPVQMPLTVIGANPAADIRIADPHVEDSHAVLFCLGGRLLLRDLDSAGGTFVNDKQVRQVELADGMMIRVGRSLLRYELRQAPLVLEVVSAIDVPAEIPTEPAADPAPPAFLEPPPPELAPEPHEGNGEAAMAPPAVDAVDDYLSLPPEQFAGSAAIDPPRLAVEAEPAAPAEGGGPPLRPVPPLLSIEAQSDDQPDDYAARIEGWGPLAIAVARIQGLGDRDLPSHSPRQSRWLLWTILIVLAVAILGVGAWLVLSGTIKL